MSLTIRAPARRRDQTRLAAIYNSRDDRPRLKRVLAEVGLISTRSVVRGDLATSAFVGSPTTTHVSVVALL